MLYSLSQAIYDNEELQNILSSVTENDAVVLWQNGVLLAVKFPHYFNDSKGQCFALEDDILSRNLTALLPQESKVRLISMTDFVEITERYFPQLAL